jgi:hypothetical protein
MKYLFKYIYKGHDRASMSMREASKPNENGKINEIEQYREARWVTPPEALWRIYGFELSKNSPPMMQLQLHLPNMHMVSFHQRQGIRRVVNRPGADRSMLMAYFEENRLDEGLVEFCTITSLSGLLGNHMIKSGKEGSRNIRTR